MNNYDKSDDKFKMDVTYEFHVPELTGQREHGEGCLCSYCSPEAPIEPVQGEIEYVDLNKPHKFKMHPTATLPLLTGGNFSSTYDLKDAMQKWRDFSGAKYSVIEENKEEKKPIVGMLVFYVNVGQLPPSKAEVLVERMKDNVKCAMDRIPGNWEIIWIPIREGETRLEMLRF
jgi:hypothetical protein